MAGIKPVVMTPDGNARAYADSSAPAREERGGLAFHSTDEMRRLATPWSVALARAKLLQSCDIPSGIVLDPACGSAIQLSALCSVLNRPGLGIELSGAAAPLAAINLERCATWTGQEWGHSSRVLWGDGIAADTILQTYHQSIGASSPIALVHIDPARPQNAQQHTLDEMQPRLDPLLSAWAPFLPKVPALILDLSPRLSDAQRMEVEGIITSIWGDVSRTWQWMTQGRGRVDRLSLWVGSCSIAQPNRLVRLSKDGGVSLLSGIQEAPIVDGGSIEIGQFLTIVDPCLVASGLAESWRNNAIDEGGSRWIKLTGRRPVLVSGNSISNQKDVRDFVQITGRVVETVSEVSFESLEGVAETANSAGVSSLKLRCQIDPDIQPKLQSAIDQKMKEYGPQSSETQGFITESGEGFAICHRM